jgi:hypothetical protein
MTTRLLSAVLVAGLSVFSCPASAQDNPNSRMMFEINVRVCEKSLDSGEIRTLAEPAIVTIAGRPFSFASGGNLEPKTDESSTARQADSANSEPVRTIPPLPTGSPKVTTMALTPEMERKLSSLGELFFGTSMTGQIQTTSTDAVQLTLKIGVGSVVSQPNDPKTDLVRSETFEFRTVMQPGETKRLACSKTQWCEIHVVRLR